MTDERIRLREEVQMQIRALQEMALMAKGYGCDITSPLRYRKVRRRWAPMATLAPRDSRPIRMPSTRNSPEKNRVAAFVLR